MKCFLLSLTWDTQFLILVKLPLDAIASLRRTCRQLKNSISRDKQLWARVLERDVLSKRINLHPLRTQLSAATAAHIESWTRCTLHLSRAHQENLQPIVRCIKSELRITWLKIIRTCWCIVASSSEKESRLTVWNIRNGELSISKEYYLAGPVVDGVVGDGGSSVMMALTIGSRDLFVHVLSLCEIGRRAATICSQATLHGVCYVRSLNGRWIVCAARNGDDTYPTLVDWKSDRRWTLLPRWYINHSNLPWGLLHCAVCAATQWLDWIVIIMSKTVEIYRIADLEKSGEGILSVASLQVKFSRIHQEDNTDGLDVEEAMFHSYEQRRTPDGHPILSFTCRAKARPYSLFSIIFSDPKFIIPEGSLEITKTSSLRNFPNGGNKFVVGHASNYEVHLRARGGYDLLPELIFVKIDRFSEDDTFLRASCPRAITKGFPLLQFTTSMDFDDGTGLLVIGTSKGRLCFARFMPEEMIANGSLMDELPAQTSRRGELSTVPVDMEIPPYFIHAQKSMYDFTLSSQYIEETVKTWPRLTHGSLLSGPWSNDWSKYEGIRHWIVPTNRWSMIDTGGFYHVDSVGSHIRLVMDTCGDIIPLAYRRDPGIVVYRIGPRYYMITSYKDEFDKLDFEDGALPNLDSTLPLDSELLESLTHSDNRISLGRYGRSGEAYLLDAAERIDYLLGVIFQNAHKLKPELSEIGLDPNSWSEDDLTMISERVADWM